MNKLDYKFKDESLFKRAMTHSSRSAENYERLEFLGDGILDFVVGEYLFKHCQDDEGKLTVIRSHFVAENNLCKVFDCLGLEKYVLLGKSYQGEISKAIKCDVVEALIAAIYLDSDLATVTKYVEKHLNLSEFRNIKNDNYKSQLQELVQASFKCKMQYVTEPVKDGFTSAFYMDEDKISSGKGQSKLEAEQAAAQKAIKKLFLIKNEKN